jgi:transposase-like protein
MKRTHKLKVLGDVAGVVASAPNLSVAAKRLGVNRSTLHRWIQAGKVQKAAPKTGPAAGAAENQAPEAWAKAVRDMGELDVTQSALLDLAAAALKMARTEEQPSVRLSAMGRYQQLVRQLNLATERAVPDALPTSARAPMAQRRAGADPRAILMAVK